MHLRLSSVTRNGITYRYAQLVESYRRPGDGMPAHRVIASLGRLSDEQVQNVRAALAANRHGQRVAVPEPGARPRSARRPRPVANLRYLDLAVLLQLCRELGLEQLLAQLMPRGQADVAPADVVAALVLQRCVDPGSKLYAERWFPRTALPELLAIAPQSFNNTRLHRVLDELDAVTPALMNRLPTLYLQQQRRPAFGVLYLDVTDAMFVGHGPALAVRAKTKEGLIKRKIGIVLLCNEQGLPLRWRVVAGNSSDGTVMLETFREVAQSRWAQHTPIVCDRAMGTTAVVRQMADTGLRFVTSITTTEYDTYAPKLPYAAFTELDPATEATPPAMAAAVEKARERAQAAGLQRVSDSLWVCDLGTVEIGGAVDLDLELAAAAHLTVGPAGVMRLCRSIEHAVAEGRFPSFNAAGRAHGLSKNSTKKYRLLGRLPLDVQEAIVSGEAQRCSLAELICIVRRPDADQQRTRFAALLQKAATRPSRRPKENPPAPAVPGDRAALPVRVVAYFNPERFVDQRLTARRRQAAIAAFEQQLNERLARARCRLNHTAILAAVDRRLRRDNLIEAYQVSVDEDRTSGRVQHRVRLKPVDAQWSRRRRVHGFSVIVAHSELTHSAAELCQIYRAKDIVEADFKVIKSVVKLRPIRHHTDTKVSAHVTLCMLALLLQRTLQHKLKGHRQQYRSAEAALEGLATCQLNRYSGKDSSAYTLTEPDTEQLALLRKLRLLLLADDDDLATRITPRL